MRVIKEQPGSGKVKPQSPAKLDQNGNRTQPLVSSVYFVVEKFELHSQQRFAAAQGKSSAQILVATEGAGTVHAADHPPVDFAKGDAVVVPACISEFDSTAESQFLEIYVPGHSVPEPQIGCPRCLPNSIHNSCPEDTLLAAKPQNAPSSCWRGRKQTMIQQTVSRAGGGGKRLGNPVKICGLKSSGSFKMRRSDDRQRWAATRASNRPRGFHSQRTDQPRSGVSPSDQLIAVPNFRGVGKARLPQPAKTLSCWESNRRAQKQATDT
jgi:hypothetical protein